MDDIKARLKSRMDDNEPVVDEELLPVREAQVFTLTAGELREVCETDPEHPVAKVYAKAARDFPDNAIMHVERVDLEALMEGKEVREEVTREHGVNVVRKTLVSRSEAKREAKKTPDPAHAAVAPARPAAKGGK